jgi:uncharacterized protein YndB with AHSA1/START domain
MDKTKVTKDLGAKTLTIERTFDAPKEKVWRAYTDKDVFVQWWGPEGWETIVKEFDFKPGGRNLYGMKCVDKNQGEFFGQESWGLMEYGEVNEPDAFSYKDFFVDPDGTKQEDMPVLTSEAKFVEQDGKTTIVSISRSESAEEIEKLLAMGMVEGISSTFDRLDQLLAR